MHFWSPQSLTWSKSACSRFHDKVVHLLLDLCHSPLHYAIFGTAEACICRRQFIVGLVIDTPVHMHACETECFDVRLFGLFNVLKDNRSVCLTTAAVVFIIHDGVMFEKYFIAIVFLSLDQFEVLHVCNRQGVKILISLSTCTFFLR